MIYLKSRSILIVLILLSVFVLAPNQADAFKPFVPQQTAFGENLTGQLTPQFQSNFAYTVSNTDLTTNTVVNGGTVTQADAMGICTTTTTTASTALLQSKQHAKYRAGLGGLSRFTALFTTGVAGTFQCVGIMDEVGSTAAFKNGYSFGYSGADFGITRFVNDAEVSIVQANWNVDAMGAGTLNPSGMTLVHTNLNVYQIRYQYLGAGAVSFFIEDDETGKFALVHKIKYTNLNIVPSVYNPNFHHTMWVDNGATVSNLIVKSASYAYFIEGRTGLMELHQSVNSSGTKQGTTITTEVAIFTIRNKTSYASKTNFIDIMILNVLGSIEASSANNLGSIRVIKNATLGGTPSYANINATNSIVEIDVAGTTVTGGVELGVGLLAGKNDDSIIDFTGEQIILNPGESITVAGTSDNSATINGFAKWKELY